MFPKLDLSCSLTRLSLAYPTQPVGSPIALPCQILPNGQLFVHVYQNSRAWYDKHGKKTVRSYRFPERRKAS